MRQGFVCTQADMGNDFEPIEDGPLRKYDRGPLRQRIERMYQRAMDLRDSTQSSIDFEPIENEYRRQYFRAYRWGCLALFKQQTREYRKLLRAFRARGGDHQ